MRRRGIYPETLESLQRAKKKRRILSRELFEEVAYIKGRWARTASLEGLMSPENRRRLHKQKRFPPPDGDHQRSGGTCQSSADEQQ
ncbi:hypothetical protein NPIL_636511 [Nephila pilipes]|uniref:Uncharacterized protein n=1 Tax=Nephila pilipes TaxID=299642 RepID=A0A8X6TY60_NEPPI|nr:hypothetical protein NPIL_636511 [Nephila pilipes]